MDGIAVVARALEARALQERPLEIGCLYRSELEASALEIGPLEARAFYVGEAEARPSQVCPLEVGADEVTIARSEGRTSTEAPYQPWLINRRVGCTNRFIIGGCYFVRVDCFRALEIRVNRRRRP
jgi:hypothetical protein